MSVLSSFLARSTPNYSLSLLVAPRPPMVRWEPFTKQIPGEEDN